MTRIKPNEIAQAQRWMRQAIDFSFLDDLQMEEWMRLEIEKALDRIFGETTT